MTRPASVHTAGVLSTLAEIDRRLADGRVGSDRERLLIRRGRLRAQLSLHEGLLLTLARGHSGPAGREASRTGGA